MLGLGLLIGCVLGFLVGLFTATVIRRINRRNIQGSKITAENL